jgi:hypothetical protein
MKFPRLLLAVLFSTTAFAGERPASVADLFGSPENFQLVQTAPKVSACILHRVAPTPRADGSVDWSTEHYEETAYVPVSDQLAATFRQLLLDTKTYDWKSSDGRRPQFYLRLKFARGEEIVAVDFCFMCHVLGITREGREIGHANFNPNSDLILQAFLKLFPNDKPLQQVAREVGLP